MCSGLWQGADCQSKWLMITMGCVFAALGLTALVMLGCFIRNAFGGKRTAGYQPIQ
jgi:hypothetical protein